MTKGKRKTKNGGHKETMNLQDIKTEPPDNTMCDVIYCTNCMKYNSHLHTLIECSERFHDSVKEEEELIDQLRELRNKEKWEEANNLANLGVKLNKKSNILKKLTTQLIQGAKEFHLCKKPWNINQTVTTNTEKIIQRIEATTKLWELVEDNFRRRLKSLQQQREAFHMTAEIAEINGRLQNQRETTTNWEYATKLEENKPKLVKILQKAELEKVDYEWELVEKLNVENFQVIKVIEIYVDFNFSDIYNPSLVSLQGVTYNEDVFEPRNKEIERPIGYSWIWSYQADIMQAVCKWNEDCWGNRISPQPWCIIDRGKIHASTDYYGKIGLWKILS